MSVGKKEAIMIRRIDAIEAQMELGITQLGEEITTLEERVEKKIEVQGGQLGEEIAEIAMIKKRIAVIEEMAKCKHRYMVAYMKECTSECAD